METEEEDFEDFTIDELNPPDREPNTSNVPESQPSNTSVSSRVSPRIGGVASRQPFVGSEPNRQADSIYADVFGELDDIFDAQDAEEGDTAGLEDVVNEALQDPDTDEVTTAPELDQRTLSEIIESLKNDMSRYDDELEKVVDLTRLEVILKDRRGILKEGLRYIAVYCETHLQAKAMAAEVELRKHFKEAEERVVQAGGEDARILAEVLASGGTISQKISRLKNTTSSRDVDIAFDRVVYEFVQRNSTISTKKQATEHASNRAMQDLMLKALDADVLQYVKRNSTISTKIEATAHASSMEIRDMMKIALNADVFQYVERNTTVTSKQQATGHASESAIAEMMMKALDFDVLQSVKRNTTIASQKQAIEYASGETEKQAMLRVVAV